MDEKFLPALAIGETVLKRVLEAVIKEVNQ